MVSMEKSPKLRFKGFNDQWTRVSLNKFTSINPRNNELPNNFIYIDLESIFQGRLVRTNKVKKESAPSRAQRILQEGDVLFQTVRPYQKNHYLYRNKFKEPTVASTGFALLRSKLKESNEFLYHLLYTSRFGNEVAIRCSGSNYPAINSSDLSEIEIQVPRINEQMKIASFFSFFDQKIEKQEERIEQLVMFKKGILQKIFSQELRFKDDRGNTFPEWKVYELDNLGEFQKTYSFSRSEEGEGEYQHIHYGDIHSKFSGIINIDTTIPTLSINPDTELTTIKNNDIIFADASEDTNDLGKSIVVLDIDDKKILSGLHTFCFRPNSNVNSLFLHYFTQTNEYKRFIYRNATGTSVYGLSKSNVAKLQVPLPCTEEQEKIAQFLYKINQKVELLNDQLFELQTLKKGLMQKMFV